VISFRPKNIAGTGATFACAFLLCGLFHNELLAILSGILLLGIIAYMITVSVLGMFVAAFLVLAFSGIGSLFLLVPVLLVIFLVRDHRRILQ